MGEKYSIPVVEGHSFELVYDNVLTNVLRFSKHYETAYKWFDFQKIQQEMQGSGSQQKWQLLQRKWESYNRPVKEGTLYILSESLGKKWKKRYCVMRSNYTLEVYASKEDYESAGKPKLSSKYSGHDVTSNVDSYLRSKFEIISREFGYINHDVLPFIKKVTLIGQRGKRPTQHIFCVGHDWRGITYFAAETAIEKDQWVRILKDSTRHLDGVQCSDEISREAFTFALEQTIRFHGNYVDGSLLCGTQKEILCDLFCDCQSYECKEILLPKIKGGFVYRFRTWDVVMAALRECVEGIVEKEFMQVRDQCHLKRKSYKQEIIINLPQLNAAYDLSANAIKGVLAECFDPIVVGEIFPRLFKVVSAMSDSLVGPLRSTRELFLSLVEGVSKVVKTKNPQFANNIDQYFLHTLDFAPRNPDFVGPVSDSNSSLKPTLDLLEEVFPKTDFSSHLNNVYIFQQKLLDAAVYTFECLCGEVVSKNDGQLTQSSITQIKNRVMKRLDCDIFVAEQCFFQAMLKSGTMEQTREAIEQACKFKMLDFEETVPAEFSSFMPISNVFTDVLTKRFNELINPALVSCMDQLISGNISDITALSYNKINSNSSTDDTQPLNMIKSQSDTQDKCDSNGEQCPQINLDENMVDNTSGMDGETGELFDHHAQKTKNNSRSTKAPGNSNGSLPQDIFAGFISSNKGMDDPCKPEKLNNIKVEGKN